MPEAPSSFTNDGTTANKERSDWQSCVKIRCQPFIMLQTSYTQHRPPEPPDYATFGYDTSGVNNITWCVVVTLYNNYTARRSCLSPEGEARQQRKWNLEKHFARITAKFFAVQTRYMLTLFARMKVWAKLTITATVETMLRACEGRIHNGASSFRLSVLQKTRAKLKQFTIKIWLKDWTWLNK